MAVLVGPAPNVSDGGTGVKVGTAVTRDVYGVTIPISAGERAFDGHIIWMKQPYQTQTTSSFPAETQNGVIISTGSIAHDVLRADFAVSLGYHLIPADERGDVKIFKIWADDQVIYDASFPTAQPQDYSFTFYKGLPNASIDPSISAELEERAVPFRNMMVLVFKGYPLATANVASANVVVNGGPQPWVPTHYPLGTLPDIRVELVDGLTITSGVTDFTMLDASLIGPDGGIYDWDNGLIYYWSAQDTSAAKLHTFDITTRTELSAVPVLGSFTNIVGTEQVGIFDENNRVIVTAINGVGNTEPIATIDMQSGTINDTFGSSSTLLHPGDASDNNSLDTGDAVVSIPWPQNGDVAYLSDGIGIRSVFCCSSLRWDLSFLPINDGGLFPGELNEERDGVKGGGSLKLPDDEDIHFVTAYPFLKFGDSVNGFQDGCVLVGAGTKLYAVCFGFRAASGSTTQRIKVLGYGLLKDFAPYTPQLCLLDPQDRGAIIFADDSGTWKATKIKSTMYDFFGNSGSWGVNAPENSDWKGRWPGYQFVASLPSSILWTVDVPPLNTTPGYHNAVKSSNFAGGTFAWLDGTHINVLQLSTGEVNSIDQSTSSISDFVWDSRSGLIYFPHGNTSTRPLGIFAVGAAAGDNYTIAQIVRWILLYSGYEDAGISVDSDLTDGVAGFLLDHPRDVGSLLRDLGEIYNFQFFESEGLAKVVRTQQLTESAPGDAAFDLTEDDLCPVQENQVSQNDNLVTVLAGPAQQVSAVSIQYSDLDQSFAWQVQTFQQDLQTSGSVASGKLVLDTPIVMHRSEAFSRATKIQAKKTASTDTHYFRLSQKYMQLEPSDLVTITKPPFRYGIRIDEDTFNADWSLSFSGSSFLFQDDIEIVDQTTDGTGDDGHGYGKADAKALAMDMPLLNPAWDAGASRFVITVGEVIYPEMTEFNGASLVYGPSPQGPFDNVGFITTDAKFGLMVGTLADTALPFQTDNTTVIRIAMRTGDIDTDWAATDADGLLAGSNTLLIGGTGRWEVVFFRDINKISDKVVEVSGILRGRRGTDVYCGMHQANDQVILVKSVATDFVEPLRPHAISLSYSGAQVRYVARGIPTIKPWVPVDVTVGGQSLKPWMPSDIHAKLGKHVNAVASTRYSNTGGSGDRTALINVTGHYTVQSAGSSPSNLVNGLTNNSTVGSIDFANGQTDVVITFDFTPTGIPQIINEYKWEQNATVSVGTYEFAGSLDGVSWDVLDVGTDLGGASSTTTVSFGNSTGYNYYRLRQTSGSTSSTPWCHEITFKIMADIADNDLLVTWKRRDRLDDHLFVEELVSESDEDVYDLQVMVSGSPAFTHSNIESSAYKLLAADQVSAGLTPPLDSISLKVYQKSAVIARGLARTVAVDVE